MGPIVDPGAAAPAPGPAERSPDPAPGVAAERPPAPRRDTIRVGSLEVDRTPVTHARYAEFVAAEHHRAPAYWSGGRPPRHLRDHPVVGVDLFDALAFARWAGGNLPTEAEWLAASGVEARTGYPWGERFDSHLCNTIRSGRKGTTPVGSYPASPSGCVDLAGNVWEMTRTRFDDDDDDAIVVKGGSWYDFPVHARLDARFRAPVAGCGATCGFRLVYGRGWSAPDWLAPDLVERAIAARRAGAARPARGDAGAPEFLATLEALRSVAEERIAALEGAANEAFGELEGALEGVECFFREAEGEAQEPVESGFRPSPRTSSSASKLLGGLRRLVNSHPAIVVASLLGAAGLVLYSAIAMAFSPEPERSPSSPVAAEAPRMTPPPPAVAPLPPPPPARTADELIAALFGGDAPSRDAAEAELVALGGGARAALDQALRRAMSPESESSIRYVLAALASHARGAPPKVVETSMGAGLFFFFETVDDASLAEARKARWTADAESIPFLAVCTGSEPRDAVTAGMADALAGATLFFDPSREIATRFRIRRTPAVAGAFGEQRLVFVHLGAIPRSALASRCRSLGVSLKGW